MVRNPGKPTVPQESHRVPNTPEVVRGRRASGELGSTLKEHASRCGRCVGTLTPMGPRRGPEDHRPAARAEPPTPRSGHPPPCEEETPAPHGGRSHADEKHHVTTSGESCHTRAEPSASKGAAKGSPGPPPTAGTWPTNTVDACPPLSPLPGKPGVRWGKSMTGATQTQTCKQPNQYESDERLQASEHDHDQSTLSLAAAAAAAASTTNISQVARRVPEPELHGWRLGAGPLRHVGDDAAPTPAPFKLHAIHGGLVAREPAAVSAGHAGALRGDELPIRIHQPTYIGDACVDDLLRKELLSRSPAPSAQGPHRR